MKPDWARLRREYAGGSTAAALSRRYGIPESTLRNRIKRENWKKIELEGGLTQKTYVEKGEPRLARLRRVDALADSMLTCLERAVAELDTVTQSVKERVKNEDGSDVTVDYIRPVSGEKGTIDRAGLKQLTGVLKDLKDVLMLRSDADIREQEARIRRIQKELEREETQSIRVTLEGGCEGFAD